MDYKYTGIILSKKDVGETDRIYMIYTQESGKIRVLGKGVRKSNAKLAGQLEPITLSEIFIAKSRGMGKVTGVIALDNFSGIKNEIVSLQKTFFVFDNFQKMVPEEEKDKKIFSLLLSFLKTLEIEAQSRDDESKMDVLTLGFMFKFFSELGYGLEMGKCVACGKKLVSGKNYFSAQKGGVLCPDCSGRNKAKLAVGDEVIKLIRIFLKNNIENLVKLKVSAKDINNLKIIAREMIGWM